MTPETLVTLSSIFGWTYFIAWSASFWPQVVLNYRRGTTHGLSPDFVTINILGFSAYTLYTLLGTAPSVKAAYVAAGGETPEVTEHDIMFAVHGVIMCSVLCLQVVLLPGGAPVRRWVLWATCTGFVAVAAGAAYAEGTGCWAGYLGVLGSVKVASSVVKHFPQVALNATRGSTVGWSFFQVGLDVIGGVFSLGQQAVQAAGAGGWAAFTGNVPKLALAAESLAFDFFFIWQHACWYTDRRDRAAESLRKVAHEEQSSLLV